MTPTEFRATIAKLGLSQGQAARLLGVTIRTTHGWANGGTIPSMAAIILRLAATGKIKLRDIEGARQ